MKVVEVAIALVWRGRELLVTRRPESAHLGGLWEFPGGKLAEGESPERCAEREVQEEVAILVTARARRDVIEHTYPERRVRLYPVDCDYRSGAVELREVSDARWILPSELSAYAFPEANRALIAAIRSAS